MLNICNELSCRCLATQISRVCIDFKQIQLIRMLAFRNNIDKESHGSRVVFLVCFWKLEVPTNRLRMLRVHAAEIKTIFMLLQAIYIDSIRAKESLLSIWYFRSSAHNKHYGVEWYFSSGQKQRQRPLSLSG